MNRTTTIRNLTPDALGRQVRVRDRQTVHDGILAGIHAEAERIEDAGLATAESHYVVGLIGVRLDFLDRWASPLLPLEAEIEFLDSEG